MVVQGDTCIFTDTNIHTSDVDIKQGCIFVFTKINIYNPDDTAKLRRLASSHKLVK